MLKVSNKIFLFLILFLNLNLNLICQIQDKSIIQNNTFQSSALPESSIYNLENNWLDQEKSNFKLKEFRGKAIVITMIYTTCKFSCPVTLAFLRNIEKQLDKSTLSNMMFVLVSMDPENDNPEKLKNFLKENELSPNNWKLLTSSEDDITELASTIGFKFKKISDKDYAHSNIITILDKNGVVVNQIEGLNDENNGLKNSIIEISK
ncbi:MAG: SCO family protein [Candidatus Kapabacteria bacterium]|nr:SCO family protein [Candidatus Kapabacteria bacterium]